MTRTKTIEKLQAVRLERADRFEASSRQLLKLAWAIELVAVVIGLSIAFSRVADANQTGSVDVSFWAGIQLIGGFIIVSMGELTKIPLSLLLVSARPLMKPIVFLLVAFISAITFETIFLSLERGYNYQKSDMQAYREEIKFLEEQLDIDTIGAERRSIENQRKAEIKNQGMLRTDHELELKSIDEDYSNVGDQVKPLGFDNAAQAVEEILLKLENLKSEFKEEIRIINEDESVERTRLINNSQPLGVDSNGSGEVTSDVKVLDDEISQLTEDKDKIKSDLKIELERIQNEYLEKKSSYLNDIDLAKKRGNDDDVKRYEVLIERLSPETEKIPVRKSADLEISRIDEQLKLFIDQKNAIILKQSSTETETSEQDKINSEVKSKELEAKIDELESDAEAKRSKASADFKKEDEILQVELDQANNKLEKLNSEWQTKREALTEQSDAQKREQKTEAERRYKVNSEAASALIRGLKASEDDLSKRIQIAIENAPGIKKEIYATRQILCVSMLNNQIFRISTRFNTAPLFGIEQSETEAKLAGGPDPDCPSQPYVDEANADRVAFLWFGSIALLAATAGAATAITSQAFLRMAETLRWQSPTELGPARRPFLSTLRLAIVNWRWKRVRTVEVERIKEIPVDIVRNVETIREIEHIVREIVPVPVFVPTGGNVESEMAKVRGHYEQLNRLSRDAIISPEPALLVGENVGDQSSPSRSEPSMSKVEDSLVNKDDKNTLIKSPDLPAKTVVTATEETYEKKV